MVTLKNNLYFINACSVFSSEAGENLSSDSRVEAIVTLCPDCYIYKAHFPEQPITPGVCIIGMATEVLGDAIKTPITLAEVLNAKFLSVINPLETRNLTLKFTRFEIDGIENRLKATCQVSDSDKVFTKLSLLFSLPAEKCPVAKT